MSRTTLVLLAALVVVAGVMMGVLIPGCRRSEQAPVPPAQSLPLPSPPAPSTPSAPPAVTPAPPAAPPVPSESPRSPVQPPNGPRHPAAGQVAIIFDDAGGSLEDLEAIIALRRPVTVAVLPGLRFSREVAERARAAGLEVLLHLPLEPDDPSQIHLMGRGGVTSTMSDEEIAAMVREDLQDVPGAVGINNHMGSKGSADARVMRAVLGVAREHRLLFVDSRTSVRTVAAQVAQEMGIPTASRAVFLDNEDDADAIRLQIVRLILLAKQRGEAVAIGHAHRLTSKVVLEMLGEFDRQGVELVAITMLVH